MDAYTGLLGACVKCGWHTHEDSTLCNKCGDMLEVTATEHVPEQHDEREVAPPGLGVAATREMVTTQPEHLLRTCPNCGYTWREKCLDSE